MLLDKRRPPLLVCVGRRGWHTEAIFGRLDRNPGLTERVRLMEDVNDATLNTLYRQALFTIYPSRYEGWGLPVTEALSRGKVVITTSVSALPEAGGELALYVPSDDPVRLAEAVETLLDDPAYLHRLEKRIGTQFRSRAWRDIAQQIIKAANRQLIPSVAADVRVRPLANPARFYSLGRIEQTLLDEGCDVGETFRIGAGWAWPERWGCRISGMKGGGLMFMVNSNILSKQPVRILLKVRGIGDKACCWQIAAEGEQLCSGIVTGGERRWIEASAKPNSDRVIHLQITTESLPEKSQTDRSNLPVRLAGETAALGIEGFFFIINDDADEVKILQEKHSFD